jgi:hypothetical protein
MAFCKFCIWVQFLGINQYLRNVDYLNLLENQLGKVLLVKIVDFFKANTSNPKIKMLVHNISNLLSKIELLRPFKIEHKIVYSRVPNQCFKCRKFNHMVDSCPIHKKGKKMQQTIFVENQMMSNEE